MPNELEACCTPFSSRVIVTIPARALLAVNDSAADTMTASSPRLNLLRSIMGTLLACSGGTDNVKKNCRVNLIGLGRKNKSQNRYFQNF